MTPSAPSEHQTANLRIVSNIYNKKKSDQGQSVKSSPRMSHMCLRQEVYIAELHNQKEHIYNVTRDRGGNIKLLNPR